MENLHLHTLFRLIQVSIEFKFALGDLNWDIVCSGMIGLIKGHQGDICSEINTPSRNR